MILYVTESMILYVTDKICMILYITSPVWYNKYDTLCTSAKTSVDKNQVPAMNSVGPETIAVDKGPAGLMEALESAKS